MNLSIIVLIYINNDIIPSNYHDTSIGNIIIPYNLPWYHTTNNDIIPYNLPVNHCLWSINPRIHRMQLIHHGHRSREIRGTQCVWCSSGIPWENHHGIYKEANETWPNEVAMWKMFFLDPYSWSYGKPLPIDRSIFQKLWKTLEFFYVW